MTHRIKSQTTFDEAKVLKKIGNWTVEKVYNPRTGKLMIVVTNGWRIDYPLRYSTGYVAYDYPEQIPAGVKKYVQEKVVFP